MSLRELMFSAQGRIPRSTWCKFNLPLLGILILGILLIVLFGPQDSGEGAFYVAAIILVIAWVITDAAFLIELGFFKGTIGANKYGPDPLGQP